MRAFRSRILASGSPDWAWGGLGVSLATASAGFAAYMIATAPAEVTGFGSKDFNIFVHWDRRNSAGDHEMLAGAGVTRPATQSAPQAIGSAPTVPPDTTQDVDPTATGSIPSGVRVSSEGRSQEHLGEFRLKNVVGDHALIEHRSKLTLVTQGSILAGAGEVLSIERQGRGWVVKTASGVIGGT